jgi:hypothetical protein
MGVNYSVTRPTLDTGRESNKKLTLGIIVEVNNRPTIWNYFQ